MTENKFFQQDRRSTPRSDSKDRRFARRPTKALWIYGAGLATLFFFVLVILYRGHF